MNVILDIMPTALKEILGKFNFESLNEIRLRAGAPIILSVSGKPYYLNSCGLSNNFEKDKTLRISQSDIETILHKASNYSVYSVNDQIKQGYITIRGGIRIGIAGEVVTNNKEIVTIKNIQSLNIRVPHEMRGCSYPVLNHIFDKHRPHRTLIISPPGCGKTTILRDLSWQISDKYHLLNTLIIDERGEISATHNGVPQLCVGEFTDIISGGTKHNGFENGVRSMRPDVVLTDEIITEGDIGMIYAASRSGVGVIATVHASDIGEIRTKPGFDKLIENRIFDRYVVLGIGEKPGKIIGVYDSNLRPLALS